MKSESLREVCTSNNAVLIDRTTISLCGGQDAVSTYVVSIGIHNTTHGPWLVGIMHTLIVVGVRREELDVLLADGGRRTLVREEP
jgi:hypothetical protein